MNKVLIGTDILLIGEMSPEELGTIEYLFEWMSRIGESPYIDFSTKILLSHHQWKLPEFLSRVPVMMVVEKKSRNLRAIEKMLDIPLPVNLHSDTSLGWKRALPHLALLEANKIDLYITDNDMIHAIAKKINLDHRVYSINSYLDRCSSEFRDKDPNKGLIIRYDLFKKLNLYDSFFDSFKRDYAEYVSWFRKKKDDYVYFSKNRKGKIQALLKLKLEDSEDEFNDIVPIMPDKKCLKISSFKVNVTGSKLAERFMRTIFNKAIEKKVDSIYVTLFNNDKGKRRLVNLLEKWGFLEWGTKYGSDELVMRRSFKKEVGRFSSIECEAYDMVFVKEYFPFHSPNFGCFIVPLHATYLDLLLGDESIDSRTDDIVPYRNAISKILILKNDIPGIKPGAVLLFYRMTHEKDKRGIAGIGIVERIKKNLDSELQFVGICKKRSGFSVAHLKECWNGFQNKPLLTLVEFLFVTHLDSDVFDEQRIIESGINTNDIHSQTILPVSLECFRKLFKDSEYERDFVAYQA